MRKNLVFTIVLTVFIAMFSIATAGAETPIGYPYTSWGEITQTIGNTSIDKGFKLDGYVEQGIDWVKLGDFTVNTFGGLRGTVSNHGDEYWNNKIGPWIGAKVTTSMKPFASQSWASMALGIRFEYYDYYDRPSPVSHDSRGVVFLQWGLGGDWKKK